MKILIVAMSDSIHTARWISQIADQGWDIHLFPSMEYVPLHPEMRNLTAHVPLYGKRNCPSSVRITGIPLFNDFVAGSLHVVLKKTGIYNDYHINRLQRVIKKIKPDIIHSLEIQHAGYLTLEAKKRFDGTFPPWIATNWGSDILLFGRLPEHENKIRDVLANAEFYSCECRRDVCLAEAFGFTGKVLPVFPNTGGFDLQAVAQLRQPGPVSERRTIMLKGYQHWAGRALVGLRALERCSELLGGYSLVVYSAFPDVEFAAKLFQQSTGVPVLIVPRDTPHREILALHGKARISIGLSISDAIATSFLEGLVMGAFPIQSWTSCADEWIEDGKTALLVPPEDPDVIEQAIRRALADDAMVNRAAELNWQVAVERLEQEQLKKRTIAFYKDVFEKGEVS